MKNEQNAGKSPQQSLIPRIRDKIDDEMKYLLLSFTPDPDDGNMRKCTGQDGQTQFPHENWAKIENQPISINEAIVGKYLNEQNRIMQGSLKEYFRADRKPNTFNKELLELEKGLLKEYFDIEEDKYVSFRLEDLTHIHIVYKSSLSKTFESPEKLMKKIDPD